MMQGAHMRARMQHNDRAQLAYLIVSLDRAKRLPDIEQLTLKLKPEPEQPKPKQTTDEMIAAAIAWTRLMGGKVYAGEKVH